MDGLGIMSSDNVPKIDFSTAASFVGFGTSLIHHAHPHPILATFAVLNDKGISVEAFPDENGP